jgi:hypothetical protein
MNFRKLLRKFFYEKVLGFRPLTVVLRHKVSNEQEKYLHSHKNFLNLKKYRSWEKGNFKNEIFLEIGFGSGEHLVNLARENKENKNLKILGVELYTPGAVKVLQKVVPQKVTEQTVYVCDVCNRRATRRHQFFCRREYRSGRWRQRGRRKLSENLIRQPVHGFL